MKLAPLLFCAALAFHHLTVRAAESPDDLADKKLKAGSEVAQVLRETTSADGSIAVLFTARKKGVKPAPWPLVIPGFEPKMCDAIHNPEYTIENVVVSLREKKRIGTVKSATKGWSPYWGASKADFSVLWGPEQEGWYYGLLCYNVGFGCDDLVLVDVDGTGMRQWSLLAQFEAAARKYMATHAKPAKGAKFSDYLITYSLLGVNKVPGVSALLDPMTVRIGFVAQIPKSDAEYEATMTVKVARSNGGPTTATILSIKPGLTEPDPRSEPAKTPPPIATPAVASAPAPAKSASAKAEAKIPSMEDFARFRKEVNAKTDTKVWKVVRKDLPKTETGYRRYVKGWLEGNVLQTMMRVDSISKEDESITLYYWRDGQLTSSFQVRTGPATKTPGVAECTETYNFVNEKLVAWKHTPDDGDGMMSPETEGFAHAGKRVLAESIEFAQPIYQAIGAD